MITIRINAARHDVTVNGEEIDISSSMSFNGKEGKIRPSKENDRISSMIIAHLQKRGMFAKENA